MALINCPECNQHVSTLAKSCPHCGAPVSEMENQKEKHDEIKVKICPRCTQTNPDSWEVCSQCGFPFVKTSEEDNQKV
jgi:predicted amidophosphoribosyltransferase